MPSKDADRRRRTYGRRPLLIAMSVLALALGGASAAAGASNVEGVWSFNGGQIAVQPSSGGTFTGTVVVATTFAECTHSVGEQIWTGMTLQPDGSYQGLHQWFLSPPTCARNPTLGPTAWRVLSEANGSSYLRVCFSHPGTSQPTIAPDGTSSGATFGCVNSALTAPLPTAPGAPGSNPGPGSGNPGTGVAGEVERLSLPSAKKCLSVRLFKIHLLDPKLDPLKTVTVTLKGHKIATSRKGKYIVATIDLKGLPRSAFTIKIHATTVLGHHLSASRTYHTCIRKIVHKPSKKKPSKKG